MSAAIFSVWPGLYADFSDYFRLYLGPFLDFLDCFLALFGKISGFLGFLRVHLGLIPSVIFRLGIENARHFVYKKRLVIDIAAFSNN